MRKISIIIVIIFTISLLFNNSCASQAKPDKQTADKETTENTQKSQGEANNELNDDLIDNFEKELEGLDL